MGDKISGYPIKTTIHVDDLLDFSNTEDAGSSYTESQKVKVSELMTYIDANVGNIYNADGTLAGNRQVTANSYYTKFIGGDVVAEMNNEVDDYGFLLQDVGQTERGRFAFDQNTASAMLELSNVSGTFFDANDGKLYVGNQSTNYLFQGVNETRQFSNSATLTGFIADRNGTKIAMRGRSNNTTSLSSTHNFGFHTGWGGNINNEGTLAVNIDNSQNVGIGLASIITAPQAKLDIYQNNAAGAKPVLRLSQDDVSEEMIDFNCVIGTGNAIEAVGGKTLTTTHFIKVTLPGGLTRYIPVGTIA